MLRLSLLLALSLAAASPCYAATQADLHAEIAALYTMKPGGLPIEQRIAKSAELDKFWQKIRADKKTYLPLLRSELRADGNPTFFYFDGAQLLRTLSSDRADGELALASIGRVGPKEVAVDGYAGALHLLAVDGFDVSALAMRFADQPKLEYFYGFHVTPMNQLSTLIWTLFPLGEERFVPVITERLRTEKNEATQKTLVFMLALAVTPEASAALTEFAARKEIGRSIRAEAKKRIAYKGHTHPHFETLSADELRKRRRAAISGSNMRHGYWTEFHELSEALMHAVAPGSKPPAT